MWILRNLQCLCVCKTVVIPQMFIRIRRCGSEFDVDVLGPESIVRHNFIQEEKLKLHNCQSASNTNSKSCASKVGVRKQPLSLRQLNDVIYHNDCSIHIHAWFALATLDHVLFLMKGCVSHMPSDWFMMCTRGICKLCLLFDLPWTGRSVNSKSRHHANMTGLKSIPPDHHQNQPLCLHLSYLWPNLLKTASMFPFKYCCGGAFANNMQSTNKICRTWYFS